MDKGIKNRFRFDSESEAFFSYLDFRNVDFDFAAEFGGLHDAVDDRLIVENLAGRNRRGLAFLDCVEERANLFVEPVSYTHLSYKTEQKGFTKSELRTLIIGFVVLVLAIAAIIYLPDALEARHLIKVENGEFVGASDNWLVANTGTSSHAKYRKIAEVDPADGYALDTETQLSPTHLDKTFNAEDENAAVKSYTVSGSNREYKALAEDTLSKYAAYVANYGVNVTSISDELQTVEINGKTLYWFTATTSYVTTSADNSSETTTKYSQNVSMYAPSDVKGTSVILSVSNTVDSEDAFIDVNEMVEVLKSAAANVSSLK